MYLDVFDRNPYGTNCWLLAAEGSDRGDRRRPRFRAGGGPCAAGRRGQAPGRRPADARPPRSRGQRGRLRRRRARATCTPPTPSRSPIPAAWGAMGPRDPSIPSVTCAPSSDGDVLRLAGVDARGAAHARPHAGSVRASGSTTRCSSSRATSSSRARSGARTSRTRSRGDAPQPRAVPDAVPTRCACFPGHGPDTTVGARARDEPVPAGAGLSRFATAAGTRRTSCSPDADRLHALYDASHTTSRGCSGSATWRRRRSSTPSCSRAPPGETSDVVSKEMYTFPDAADRSVTLRPEGTAAVVRAYLADRARPADAVQGVLRGASLPIRQAAGRPPARVPAVRGRGARRRRSRGATSR